MTLKNYAYAHATLRVTGISSAQGPPIVMTYYGPTGDELLEQISATTQGASPLETFGYVGYFYHAASGLDFAFNRAYDPTHARWLNRDLIGEAGGVNVYAYVGGNPVNLTDHLGWVGEDSFMYILSEYLPDVAAYVAEASPVAAGSLLVYSVAQAVNYYCDGCVDNAGATIGGAVYEYINPYTPPTPPPIPSPAPAPPPTQPSPSCTQ